MNEEWRQIVGAWPGYEVSNLGHARRREVVSPAGYLLEDGPIYACDQNGRAKISYIDESGKRVIRMLGRTVWVAFVGDIPEGHYIHHMDGDRFNNELSNLEINRKRGLKWEATD